MVQTPDPAMTTGTSEIKTMLTLETMGTKASVFQGILSTLQPKLRSCTDL